MTPDQLVLVTPDDEPVGSAEKMLVHREGLLHRAFSVFLFNERGEMLLQRRADAKYHSAGLWSNTCCGHPMPGEATDDGARRRLLEEMGIECRLDHLGRFRYRAEFSDGLIEHEVDHVFVGRYDGSVIPNPDEVGEWRWLAPDKVEEEIAMAPNRFTAWFPDAARRFGLFMSRDGHDFY